MKRLMGLHATFLTAATVLSACSGEDAAPVVPLELCDGGEGLSLVVRREGSWSGDTLMDRNGAQYLYVSRTCEFWARDDSWFGFHGVLTPAQARQVHDAIEYDALAANGGSWDSPGCLDGDVVEVFANGTQTSCYCGCDERATPQAVRAAMAQFAPLVDLALAAGQPFAGPGRLSVSEGGGFGVESQPWTGSVALRSLVIPRDASAEQLRDGVLVATDVAEFVREAARQYVAGGGLLFTTFDLQFVEDGVDFRVKLVDELPFDTQF